jgi:hypothetical protein
MELKHKQYACHTGGAAGSDLIFEVESLKKGFNVKSYSFKGHNTKSNNRVVLSEEELKEGFEHIKKTNKRLNRNILNAAPYTKNLIARDWFQVKNADAIFAIGNIETPSTVAGGTGYACSCAVDNKKPIYFFEQNDNQWYYYDYQSDKFEIYESVPKLTENFAGIGTRDINDNGVKAIISLFQTI